MVWGVGCGEGVSSSPLGEGSEDGVCPSPENFSISDLKMVSSDAFHVFLQFRSICQHLGRNYLRGPSPPAKYWGDHVPSSPTDDAYAAWVVMRSTIGL